VVVSIRPAYMLTWKLMQMLLRHTQVTMYQAQVEVTQKEGNNMWNTLMSLINWHLSESVFADT